MGRGTLLDPAENEDVGRALIEVPPALGGRGTLRLAAIELFGPLTLFAEVLLFAVTALFERAKLCGGRGT